MVCHQPLRRQSELPDCRNRYLVHYPFGLRAQVGTDKPSNEVAASRYGMVGDVLPSPRFGPMPS